MTPRVIALRWVSAIAATALLLIAAAAPTAGQQSAPQDDPSRFRFRTGVDLVNVTATVTDRQGRFVSNLARGDFVVYEDERPQQISHFVNGRVPVSLGLAVDTSGSMAGDKIEAAREALRRFLEDLLGPDDEVFVYRFSETPELVQEWTKDRGVLRQRLGALRPNGGTALYDTVADAVAMAQSGQHRKKALVIISDGNDTNSSFKVDDVQQRIRETEVLVYAVGIDGQSEGPRVVGRPQQPRPPVRLPFPLPIPGGGLRLPRPQRPLPPMPPPFPPPQWPVGTLSSARDDRVNEPALRAMTDDSGGRTEVIHTAVDLAPATAAIADELSQQYFIGYPAAARKDGRWHSIRVEVRNPAYRVRARRGYVY